MTSGPVTTTKARFGFALEYVDDLAAVKRFYTDILGLEVEREHPTFVQFKDGTGDTFAIASDASMTGKRETELYWLVEDAEAALKAVGQRAEVSMPLKQLPFGKVFGIKDPTGQPRYLVELAKNRPSKVV